MMRPSIRSVIPIILSSIWIGFVCAISFMEAWIKFRPENVTLAIGLSIGQVVFSALNKAEWIFAIALVIFLSLIKNQLLKKHSIFLGLAIGILVLQSFYFIPVLNDRIELILLGIQPKSSIIHLLYVVTEISKVLLLLVFALTFPQKKKN